MEQGVSDFPADVVLLRDVVEDDLVIFFEQQRDPAANRMAGFPARDRDAFMAHWTKILGDGNVIKKTVVFRGQVAGNIVCFEQADSRLVGYWLGKQFWGKGIATRALSGFLEEVRTRPLHAYVFKQNAGSIRVLEKCGFTLLQEDNTLANADGDGVEEFVFVLAK